MKTTTKWTMWFRTVKKKKITVTHTEEDVYGAINKARRKWKAHNPGEIMTIEKN